MTRGWIAALWLLTGCASSELTTVPMAHDGDVVKFLNAGGLRVAPSVSRLEALSEAALGTKYIVEPLGEGADGRFDQDPLYRFDGYDCTTYVETMIAGTLGKTPEDFATFMRKIRYLDGRVDFKDRNHFPDLDWTPRNINNGVIVDVTETLEQGKTRVAEITIDKRKWFQNLGASRVKLAQFSESQRETKLNELRAEGESFAPTKVQLRYLSFENFVVASALQYRASSVLEKIPSGTFFNLVREYPNEKDQVRTGLLVWHQGIFIRKRGQLYVRHAFAGGDKTVAEIPAFNFILMQYLQQRQDGSAGAGLTLFRIKGI